MKKIIEFIVKNIVEQTDKIAIEESQDDRGELIKLRVGPDDMGKIIGKSGRTIKAIRSILRIKAMKEGRRVFLDLTPS